MPCPGRKRLKEVWINPPMIDKDTSSASFDIGNMCILFIARQLAAAAAASLLFPPGQSGSACDLVQQLFYKLQRILTACRIFIYTDCPQMFSFHRKWCDEESLGIIWIAGLNHKGWKWPRSRINYLSFLILREETITSNFDAARKWMR